METKIIEIINRKDGKTKKLLAVTTSYLEYIPSERKVVYYKPFLNGYCDIKYDKNEIFINTDEYVIIRSAGYSFTSD